MAVLGVKGMAELKVGDMVTIVAAAREVHLRATKVSKDKAVEAKPEDHSATPQKRQPGAAKPETTERTREAGAHATGPVDSAARLRLLEKLKAAPANTWIEVPGSALMRVAPKQEQFPKTWPICGPASVVSAWCGAALDTKRDRLVIWGGGHADYHGNELYAFDVEKLAWQRLTDPFPNPVKDQEVNADGTPNSRHTYGGLAYLAHADRFFGLGGSLAGVGFAKCDRTWTYDFDARKWEDRQPHGKLPGGGFCLGCAYDPGSKKLYFGSEHNGLFAYDYDKNTWIHSITSRSMAWVLPWIRNGKLLVGAGRGRLASTTLAGTTSSSRTSRFQVARKWSGRATQPDWTTTRCGSHRRMGVMGTGEGLRPRPRCQAMGIAADGRRAEGCSLARNGVFGRWRYVPSVNAFIAVTDANANVFFYKHVPGKGIAATHAPE